MVETFKAEVLKCDLCEDPITDNVEQLSHRIEILDEIDESYESEYDKHEPRLLLCSFCVKEYDIPSYY